VAAIQYVSLKLMLRFGTLLSLVPNSETNTNAEDLNAKVESLDANTKDT